MIDHTPERTERLRSSARETLKVMITPKYGLVSIRPFVVWSEDGSVGVGMSEVIERDEAGAIVRRDVEKTGTSIWFAWWLITHLA